MRAFLFRVELDRLTGIQCPFHADVSMPQWSSIFRSHDYGLCRSLPMARSGSSLTSVAPTQGSAPTTALGACELYHGIDLSAGADLPLPISSS
jgi:hypothetical protein